MKKKICTSDEGRGEKQETQNTHVIETATEDGRGKQERPVPNPPHKPRGISFLFRPCYGRQGGGNPTPAQRALFRHTEALVEPEET